MPYPPGRLTQSKPRTLPRQDQPRNKFVVSGLGMAVILVLTVSSPPLLAYPLTRLEPLRNGAPGMLQPHTGSLLVDYYEAFLRDQDVDAFRRSVTARYGEATLTRLLHSGDLRARRASVLALGLFGGFESNAAVAHALKDTDPTIRNLADNALWAIWYRAHTPENNKALERIHDQIGRGQFLEAVRSADALIAEAPGFAEAYNQRAIANFRRGRFAESIADCRAVVERNPFHTGALSGMGQCLLRVGQIEEALTTFRTALEIQPYNESLRQVVAELEAEGR